jgi:DNA-binding protein H-NS
MNKSFDPKKPGKVVAGDAPQVPAIPKPPNRWKQFRRLMNDLDEIRETFDGLGELMVDMRNRKPGEPPTDLQYAQLLDCDKQKIARCRLWLNEIDCADCYEEGDEDDEQPILRKKIISKRLALMLGAVHIGGPQTPEAFLKMLLEHVYDAEVSYLALESGCRQIEQTQKYVPTISEVLKVLKAHEEQWDKRKWALREIEWRANYLQEQIRKAQAKYAGERLDEAKNRVKGDVWDAQARARQAYQNVEAGMDQLAKDQAALDAAVGEVVAVAAPPVPALSPAALAATLTQPRSEWEQFRILMNRLDAIRESYNDLGKLQYRVGVQPADLRRVRLNLLQKAYLAWCHQWLHKVDRADYYEEAIVVGDDRTSPTIPRLSEETISKRLSVMLATVHIGGSQNLEIFLQNLSQYVYNGRFSYLALESACREIEQTGKYPTISKVLETLEAHEKQWDDRKSALNRIEQISADLLKKIPEVQADLVRKRQEEAREAYQRVEATMERLAKDQQSCAEAKAALDAAAAAAKVADEPKGATQPQGRAGNPATTSSSR